MYKITIQGKTYRTKNSTAEYRAGWLAPQLREKVQHIQNEEKLINHFPFVEEKLDGRKKEARNLPWFTWGHII